MYRGRYNFGITLFYLKIYEKQLLISSMIIVKTYCAIEKSLKGAAVNVIYGA